VRARAGQPTAMQETGNRACRGEGRHRRPCKTNGPAPRASVHRAVLLRMAYARAPQPGAPSAASGRVAQRVRQPRRGRALAARGMRSGTQHARRARRTRGAPAARSRGSRPADARLVAEGEWQSDPLPRFFRGKHNLKQFAST
jgi:hypothetical protein